jgi:serine/threonine protein kinase
MLPENPMRCPACQTENDPDSPACFNCGLAFSPPVKRGTVIAGRYEILDPIGRGGMGTVYRARDRVLGDKVAVKVLKSELSRRPEMIRRFRSEMAMARKVRHPNVCRIYAAGEEAGRLYLTMELIDGTDLRTILRQRKSGLAPEQAFEYAVELAGALQALHDAGIVHRDVKAPNIMVDKKGPHLMDFDIAKQHQSEGKDAATVTGQVLGTPEYMSPEYARGDPVDFRNDIYSLGVLTFEMFTGDVPFRGDSPLATILKHLNEPPPLEGPRAKGLPPSVVPVLRKALAKRPDERHSTARGLAMALGLARTAFAALAPPPKESTPPLPALLEALNPLDYTVRMPAMTPRGGLDTRSMKAIPALIDALKRPPVPPAVEVPPMPAPPPDPQDPLTVLIGALKSKDQRDRVQAARKLGGIGADAGRAIPVLLEVLRDGEVKVRTEAARALERMGPAAQAALSASLRDEDPVVRRIAAEALARILRRKRDRTD